MKLRRVHAGYYETADGRFVVQSDEHSVEGCECAVCLSGADYACPNGGWHTYRAWVIWDNERDNYAEGTGPMHFETMREARDWLMYLLTRGGGP